MECQPSNKEILLKEIPFVEQIIQDECWYEGERQHHNINEAEIFNKLFDIIQREGETLRKLAILQIQNECNKDCQNCPFYK